MSDKMYWCLDVGHGENTFDERGSKGIRLSDGTVFEEHHFNSAVAIYAKELAEHNGFNIYLSQQPYSNETHLRQRTTKINRENVYATISIHANAGVHNSDGACCFYWYTSDNSKRLATTWKDNWSKVINEVDFHGSGLHESKPNSWTNLHMCRETKMPSILIEHGFFTSEEDIKYILSDEYRKKCAEVIVRTMCEYAGVEFKPMSNESDATVQFEGKEVVALLKEGRTYVQVRELAELLGLQIGWDQKQKKVTLKK